MNRFPFAIAALMTAVMLAGCETGERQRAQQAISDASIAAAVEAKLTGDAASNFSRVHVVSDHGVIHLNGVVTSAPQRSRAEALSRQVRGVSRVENAIRIQPDRTGKLTE